MKNKKGFTLVELLAVIVILALIMSIAIISIGGVLNSARQSTMKETAVSIINGVRQQIIVANELQEGDYLFTKALLEKGGDKSPLGGAYKIATSINGTGDGNYDCTGTGQLRIGDNICRIAAIGTKTTCDANSKSFVRVKKNGTTYTYSICLITDGAKSIKVSDTATEDSSEANLLDSNNNSMIKDTTSSTPAATTAP